ncbi:alpha-amylase [Bacteroidia bacterium]|nr:alpha-amylase [Bacteroidia bacterium]
MKEKILIYQVLPRLFGNHKPNPVPHGTITENGCGKLSAFTPKVLKEIRKLGFSHIWYTGLLEHATQTVYPDIRPDHPAVVKGKAGSPYAIKDYYDIDPDLADVVPDRMKEFEKLVVRTHKAGLKFIMDFVPNHVARGYNSDAKPDSVIDLGAADNLHTSFARNNNFYYLPGQQFQITHESRPANYHESPAKVTGNDCFSPHPTPNDWYETVKLNYGIDYLNGGRTHFSPIPDTWKKMTDILLFWASKQVDGFRCDMAEMVPVEFWEYAIPKVKEKHPGIIFIAEVYNPEQYRNYLQRGHFDYLYDKVGLYDTLRAVVTGNLPASAITACWQSTGDIQPNMLNFLENHDEQRIASDFFAGDAQKAIPALAVALFMNTSPFMVYFGQTIGERGMDAEGFSGRDGRTTIFDYWSMPNCLSPITAEQKKLRSCYAEWLNLANSNSALREGDFYDLMYANPSGEGFNPDKQYAFLRSDGKDLVLVVANFDAQPKDARVFLPAHAFDHFGIRSKALRDTYCELHLEGYGAVITEICRHTSYLRPPKTA